LKPRNILVTSEGEVRILDFGSAQKIVRTQSHEGRSDREPRTGTLAYASCELLQGRAAEPSDDLYALACICYEVLTGEHPFARRAATLARDFGVRATRPAGITGRQWRTLQKGLSWHRSGRSKGVKLWIHALTHPIAKQRSITPLREIRAARPALPLLHSRASAVLVAVLLVAGVCITQLHETSAQKTGDGVITDATAASLMTPAAEPMPAATKPPLAVAPVDARPAAAIGAANGTAQAKPSARQSPVSISIDGYQVSSGDHFVEIRVHRNQSQKNASFAWWTEPATARPDVDYVHQAKAIETLTPDRRSTRFYVKLLPEPGRSQRNYFYVAIAQPGRDRISNTVTRLQIWLPTPRDQLQARR